MKSDEILQLAKNYMINRKIEIVLPGKIGKNDGDRMEVIFLEPDALNPDIIVCPPDNRVWVNVKTKEVTWIEQM